MCGSPVLKGFLFWCVCLQQDTQPAVSTDTDGGSDGISRASQLLHTSDMEDSLMQVWILLRSFKAALHSVREESFIINCSDHRIWMLPGHPFSTRRLSFDV